MLYPIYPIYYILYIINITPFFISLTVRRDKVVRAIQAHHVMKPKVSIDPQGYGTRSLDRAQKVVFLQKKRRVTRNRIGELVYQKVVFLTKNGRLPETV